MVEETKIKSLGDFIYKVIEGYESLEKLTEDEKLFWFRGENSSEFKTSLIPNAYRSYGELIHSSNKDFSVPEGYIELEDRVRVEFFRYALPNINQLRLKNTDWNRYYLMQHYKMKTRLLDWSENALVALFFAVSGNAQSDGVVWILDPYKLNKAALNTTFNNTKNYNFIAAPITIKKLKQLFNPEGKININQLTTRYLLMHFKEDEVEGQENNHYYPLPIFPCYIDERTRAQKTCFTIFGNRINGLNSLAKNNDGILKKIIIDRSSKSKILDQLRLVGFDNFSVFPDLDGIGSSIQSKYEKEFLDNGGALFSALKEKYGKSI